MHNTKPSIIAHFDANKEGRDFVMGDLHGCYSLLMARLDEVNFDRSVDRLFSTGDLIDRGPDSLACLRLIDEPWFFAVRGNHEDLMLAALFEEGATQPDAGMWIPNGGNWVFAEWPKQEDVPLDLMRRVAALPFVIVVNLPNGERVNILHAELPDGTTDEDIDSGRPGDPVYLIWARTRISHSDRDYTEADSGLSRTIVGHTPVKEPSVIGAYTFIDTGAFHTGNLTVVQIA